jgi:TolB protein
VSYDDGVITRLTEDPAQDYEPSWSPDGEQILFLSRRIRSSQVFVLSVDGGQPLALTEAYSHKLDAAWSPVGQRIAFTMLDGYNQGDVYVMAVDGSGLANLTEHRANDCCVAWSPDGGRIAFLSSRDERAASNFASAAAYRYGGQLVYAGNKGAPVAMPRPLTTVMPESPKDVYVIHPDGSGLINLTAGRGREDDHAWSPDGKWMAFVSDRDGNDEIYLLNVEQALDGSGSPIRLTDSRDDDAGPVWSPDGACIAFASYGDDSSGLYVMGVDGSGPTRLADGVYWNSDLSWYP